MIEIKCKVCKINSYNVVKNCECGCNDLVACHRCYMEIPKHIPHKQHDKYLLIKISKL